MYLNLFFKKSGNSYPYIIRSYPYIIRFHRQISSLQRFQEKRYNEENQLQLTKVKFLYSNSKSINPHSYTINNQGSGNDDVILWDKEFMYMAAFASSGALPTISTLSHSYQSYANYTKEENYEHFNLYMVF